MHNMDSLCLSLLQIWRETDACLRRMTGNCIICAMQNLLLTGTNVRLTDMTEADVIQFYEWFWNSPPERMTCWPVEPMTLEETLERFRAPAIPNAPKRLAIRRTADDILVGRISYFNVNTRNQSAEIGYLIGPDFRGKGYASEALGLLVRYLFEELKMNRIHAQTGAFNTSSIALLESHGFALEARLRQHHKVEDVFHDDLIYGILASEYPPRKSNK